MSDSSGIIVFMMFFMLIGAGAAYYFLIYKPSLIVNCVGAWGNTGTCTNSLQTQTYKITTSNAFGGTACSNVTGDTKTIACTQATATYAKPPTGFSICTKDGTAAVAYATITTKTATECEANCSSNTTCTAYETDTDNTNCLLYGNTNEVTSLESGKNKCHLKNI